MISRKTIELAIEALEEKFAKFPPFVMSVQSIEINRIYTKAFAELEDALKEMDKEKTNLIHYIAEQKLSTEE